ncbi:hypothetical protein WG66_014866 [Moniliophthora roreri]|nr:hypothetical protein WG66_014866 [Moniliophthora roreri]
MSGRWDQKYHVDADGQNLEDFEPLSPSPVPYSDHRFYYHGPPHLYPMDGTGPTNPYSSSRVEEGHPNVMRNMDDLSQTCFSNGLVSAPNSGHIRNLLASPRYATPYGYVGSSDSEDRSNDYMNTATGPSFPYPDHQSLQTVTYRGESLAANAAGSLYIPPGTGWEISDSGHRYDATHPLSTTSDSAKSVPDPNGQHRVFKKVVATGGVVDASMRRRHPTRPSRLYRCTGFPPCQATFTTSHNLKSKFHYIFYEVHWGLTLF